MKKLVTTTRFRYNLAFDVAGVHVNLLHVYTVVTDEVMSGNRTFLTHQHPYTEIHYVLDGTCEIVFGERTFTLSPGKFLLIPPDVPHRMIQQAPVARFLVCMQLFPPSPAAESGRAERPFFSTLQPERPVLLTAKEHGELYRALEQLMQHHLIPLEVGRPDPLFRDKLQAHITLLLYALYDALPAPTAQSGPSERSGITQQRLYIEDHFTGYRDNNSRAKQLASRLQMSTRQLSRTLKSSIGMNFRQKNNATRLELARRMLAETDLSVARIAEDLGYSSSTTFGTFIRSQTGLSPTQLRRRLREEI